MLVVSPMAGVTDAPFRQIAIENGADYGISEMITSQTQLWDSAKTRQRLKSNFSESPKIIQIAGASPEIIRDAAVACIDQNVDAIEINMGCPAKKVCNVLAGSALLKDEILVAQILKSAVNSVNVPIFLKTRLGWNHENKNILKIAQIAEESGIKSLAIHGRTRSDMYNGEATFDLIAQVKQQVKIPVFANGDINTPEKAFEVLDYTKVDGLYIGRGALGRPWLFNQIKDKLKNTIPTMDYSSVSYVYAVILRHIKNIHEHYGDFMGVKFARKHIKWYLYANENIFLEHEQMFARFAQLEDTDSQIDMITDWF